MLRRRTIFAPASGREGSGAWAIDPGLADRLWALSEELTGVEFK
jgi:hypothetical protein